MGKKRLAEAVLRISSHTPFPCLQERSLGYARDDGTGKRSPHICFQPITQKVAKGNAVSLVSSSRPKWRDLYCTTLISMHAVMGKKRLAEAVLRISSHTPFPCLQERSLGYARDDGTGKRSPHICFQPITQKVAKGNAVSLVSSSRPKWRDLYCTTLISMHAVMGK